MQKWSALLLIFSLLFPFLLKNGAMFEFYNTALFLRKERCKQVTILTCAGKCQLVKVMKELPSSSSPSSMPQAADHEISPFELPVAGLDLKKESKPNPNIYNYLIAQVSQGFLANLDRPPSFFIL